jgi:hypothetical protein
MARSILVAVVLLMAGSRQVSSAARQPSLPAFVDEAPIAGRVVQHARTVAPVAATSAIVLADHRYAERTRSYP